MSPARRWLLRQAAAAVHRGRQRGRAWLERHPRLERLLTRSGSLHVDEFTLARGVAVGVFIGLTPTLGVQTLLMLAGSVAFRANFPAAFAASWINNPFTVAPLYLGFHSLGERALALLPVRFDHLSGLEEEIAEQTTALLLGSLCIAAPAALSGYLGFLYLWRRWHVHREAVVPDPPRE